MWARKRAAWDGWYKKQRWRNWSRLQLQEHPLCCMCLDNGIVMEATVADHIIPHHGDEQMFWFGKLQSLCRPHHDGRKQQQEKKGYANDIGVDGWSIDQAHPVYKADENWTDTPCEEGPGRKPRSEGNDVPVRSPQK